MISKTIETDKYIMHIHDDISVLEYIIKEGVTLTKEDVILAKERLVAIRPGAKYFVLGESNDFFTFTKEAREHTATKEHSDNVIMVAFFTTNPSLLFLGQIYNSIN